MIKRGLMELLFSAFSIERWNDHPRTAQFTEMDKQAHKAMIAYVIARTEEDKGAVVDWDRLIEGGIFEFLHRVLVTDIKPPIFHQLMADSKQKRQLNNWVLVQLKPLLSALPGGVCQRCEKWFESGDEDLERRILGAAHYMATRWEFNFIYEWSRSLVGIDLTRQQIMGQIERYDDLAAVQQFLSSIASGRSEGLFAFISLFGQLQFQKRWAQLQRLPPTSVLGHLLMVAVLSWLISLEVNAGPKRRRNNFYCGLFHDLPEVLTRDIISPVKRSVRGLDDLIKELENRSIHETIFPLLPVSWQEDILYYTMDEFKSRRRLCGKVELLDRDLGPEDDAPQMDAVDGRIVEVCDKLSAYIEASESIRLGVAPQQLRDAKRHIDSLFGTAVISGYDAGQLFDYYR